MQALLSWRTGGTYREDPARPLRLVLWQPREEARGPSEYRTARRWWRLDPSRFADVKAQRAILAYSGALIGADGRTWIVRLDARTGLPIDVNDGLLSPAGAGGAVSAPAPRPIAVPTSSRPWQVATGKAGWKAWTAPTKAALVPVAAKVVSGKRIDLTDGQAAFAATYDAKANLLGILGKAYRPGPALASLLKKRTK